MGFVQHFVLALLTRPALHANIWLVLPNSGMRSHFACVFDYSVALRGAMLLFLLMVLDLRKRAYSLSCIDYSHMKKIASADHVAHDHVTN